MTFDPRADLAQQLRPSNETGRYTTSSSRTSWTLSSSPPKKNPTETRKALSVSPPSYDDATASTGKVERGDDNDKDDAVLQDLMGRYGMGTTMMCPKVPDFEDGHKKKNKEGNTTPKVKSKSKSREVDPDDAALQASMGKYGMGTSMMCPVLPNFEAKAKNKGKEKTKPNRTSSSSSSVSGSSSSSRSSVRSNLSAAWKRVKEYSPPQTSLEYLANKG